MHEFDKVEDWLEFALNWADEQAANMYATLHEDISNHIQVGYLNLKFPITLKGGEQVSKIPPREILAAYVEERDDENRHSIFEIDPARTAEFEAAQRYATLVPNGNPFLNTLRKVSNPAYLKSLFNMD